MANVAPSPTHRERSATPKVEGTAITVSGTATDPAGANDTLTYAWSVYKDGSTTAFASGSGMADQFQLHAGRQRQLRDQADGQRRGRRQHHGRSQTISVANVAPSANDRERSATDTVEGTTITVTGTATDPAGANDTLTYAWRSQGRRTTAFASGSGMADQFSFTPTTTPATRSG